MCFASQMKTFCLFLVKNVGHLYVWVGLFVVFFLFSFVFSPPHGV